jgi:15-cis-phytoene synthase
MDQKDAMERGYRLAGRITRQFAKTFYFASRFLPQDKRQASYCVYALCRLSDETVDTPQDYYLSGLAAIRENIGLAYSKAALKEDLLLSFRETVTRYEIPREYFEKILEGMSMDLKIRRYATFKDLYDYCYKVAGVVGLIMLKILGYRDQEAEKHAVELGIAMQLTNILRDIKEDFLRGRIYLPQEDLQRFNVTEEDISKGIVNEAFRSLLKFEIGRARQYYTASSAGIRFIPQANSRFVVCAMKKIYGGILEAIERNNYDVFTRRAAVGGLRKVILACSLLLKGPDR